MQMCGTGSMENRSRLYFPNPANLTERRFCVAECPGWADANATVDDLADPATWVCTGKYSGGPPAVFGCSAQGRCSQGFRELLE